LKVGSPNLVKWGAPPQRHFSVFEGGFTLIELMIVIAIILILIGMAVPRYDRIVQHSKEAVLKHNLETIRDVIDQYTLDKKAAPQSVEELAQAGYLHEVPVDPIVRARDWVPQFDSVVLTPEQTHTGIVNVHSKSTGTALDGTKYSDW
jgi:general secretion pathway protein G